MGLYLNIASGVHPAPAPWVNVDMYHPDDWHVDVVTDCRDLPFPGESAERVNMGHILEHLSYGDDAPLALREAWRVLEWNGTLGVVGPAMDYAEETGQPESILDAIRAESEKYVMESGVIVYDSDSKPGLGHLWTATSRNTLVLVQSVFPNAIEVPCGMLHRDVGWPSTDSAQWQVAIMATKVDG